MCRFCDESDETIIDALRECPALVQSRLSHLGEYLIPNSGLNPSEVRKIVKFLLVIGLDIISYHNQEQNSSFRTQCDFP